MAAIPTNLRARIDAADHSECRYCRTSEANSGIPLSYDHIDPRAKGGETSFENVCRCCRPCNEFKSDVATVTDPSTGEQAVLFNPRRQRWTDHFAWSADTTKVEGLTPTGRATVVALRMNRPMIVAARSRWFLVGWHPPPEE